MFDVLKGEPWIAVFFGRGPGPCTTFAQHLQTMDWEGPLGPLPFSEVSNVTATFHPSSERALAQAWITHGEKIISEKAAGLLLGGAPKAPPFSQML